MHLPRRCLALLVAIVSLAAAGCGEDPLEESGLWNRAQEQLGDVPPAFVLDGAAVVRLIGALLPAQHFAEAAPYVEGLDVIASGSERDGDRARCRFAIGAR